MDRLILADAQWAIIEPHCMGKPSDPGCTDSNVRLFVEAALWQARTGAPWRDLPEMFGHWNTVYSRFRRWKKRNVFSNIFEAASTNAALEYAMVGPPMTNALCEFSWDPRWMEPS